MSVVPHPSVEQLLGGDPTSVGHAARCASCRRLAALVGFELPAPDLAELPAIDDALYSDWTEIADARGGMGRISRARDRRLGRVVAIKQLRLVEDDAERAALRRRFEREARLTARLQHPAIVGIYEAGRFGDGEPFYAMPLLRGAPLGQELARRRALAERLALLPRLIAVADAVAYTHEQRIVHRDVKPDNILVGSFGETVLIDWGLAKDLDAGPDDAADADAGADGGLTVLGVGTPAYMPPEQALGREPDERVDVYALGATLYHLLAGAAPYEGVADTRRALAVGPPAPLAELAPEAPGELLDIVARAMARDPAARYQTAQELADELRRFQTGQLLRSRRYTLGELLRHWMKRHRTALRVAIVAAVALAVLAVIAVIRVTRERDRARAGEARAELELRRAQGVVASRLAADPYRRVEAIVMGIRAVGPELRAGRAPAAESFQGLLDALTAGPAVVPLDHVGVIKSFGWSGDRLYGVDDSRALVVWDAATGAELARYPSSMPTPEHLEISPDGTRAVVWGFDPVAEIYDLATGAARRIDAATNVQCAWAPDGALVTAAEELVVRDPDTLAVRERFALPAVASDVAVRADGLIAAATIDGTLWLRRPGEPPELRPAGTTGWLLFVSGGRELIQMGMDQVVRRWPIDPVGAAAAIVHEEREIKLGAAMLSTDDHTVALNLFGEGGERRARIVAPDGAARVVDNMVHQWLDDRWVIAAGIGPLGVTDVATGGTVLALRAHADEVSARARGDRLVSADRSGPAFLWDLGSGRAHGRLLGHTAEVMTAAASSDGARLATASLDGTVRIWALDDGRAIARIDTGAAVLAAAWDGDRVRALGLDGAVRTYAADGALIDTLRRDALASVLADGAIGFVDGTIVAGDVTITSDAGAVTALVRAGDRIYSGHADGSTRLWDARTGAAVAARADAEPIDEPDDHDGHVALHLTPDGATLLASRPIGHTLTFAAADLAPGAPRDGRAAGPPSPFGPDGRAATITADAAVLVDAHRLTGHRAIVLATAWSADAAIVASGDLDGVIQLWDAARGVAIARIAGDDLGGVTTLTFAGDDVIAGFTSGALRVIPVTPAAALARGCAIAARFGQVVDYCSSRTP